MTHARNPNDEYKTLCGASSVDRFLIVVDDDVQVTCPKCRRALIERSKR